MKEKVFSILFALFGTFLVHGQTVTLKDSAFVACLRKYGNTINSSGKLVISEAAKVQSITCTSGTIESVEGLQYLTGVTSINLQTNQISYIPDISALTKLKTFNVAENNLTDLPDFSKIPGLQEIFVQRNQIAVLRDLSMNDSLKTLYIHSNKLDTLPDLSNLTQLQVLNLTYNNLKYIPNLEKLTSLQSLACWKNQLVALPPLDSLSDLVSLDASYNKLTDMPSFGSKPQLQIIYLNDNLIDSLSDLSKCPALQNVRLYKNPLTFRQLLSLETKPGYDTLVKLNPQQPHRVGVSAQVKEADTLVLRTGIDKGVPRVRYFWYRNGILVDSVLNDSFVVVNIQFPDSGKYTCQIKHPDFHYVSLITDTFYVHVTPCINMGNVQIHTTDISCLNSGTVNVTVDDFSTIASFELASSSGKKYTSSQGKFSGLSETAYSLSILTKSACRKEYPSQVHLNQKECEEVLLSPDNDGISDTYYFPDLGKVTIYDKRGQSIKTFSIPGEWDGTSDKGKVFSGFYVADINNGKKLVGITVLY